MTINITKIPDVLNKVWDFFIEEYNRTIDRYKKFSPPKWKKWSKYLLNLISVLR